MYWVKQLIEEIIVDSQEWQISSTFIKIIFKKEIQKMLKFFI